MTKTRFRKFGFNLIIKNGMASSGKREDPFYGWDVRSDILGKMIEKKSTEKSTKEGCPEFLKLRYWWN